MHNCWGNFYQYVTPNGVIGVGKSTHLVTHHLVETHGRACIGTCV